MKKISLILTAFAFIGLLLFAIPFGTKGKEDKLKGVKNPIPNRYIVVLEDSAAGELGASSKSEELSAALSGEYGGKVDRIFKHALNGYSVEMQAKEAETLSRDPRVKYVEEDGEVSIDATQTGATWGLDRIDQRDLPLNTTYTYTPTGSGVHAYIIDTGIRVTHGQFGGRAVLSFDSIGDGQNGNDCNGHGTHVAGTVGSATYGVAKGVTLHAVRVLNCSGSGTNAGVIAGVDWVRNNRVTPAVANMSLGGGASQAVDDSVANASAAGVTFVVAAGNSNTNACNSSPARAPSAVTVGSTTTTDARSSFSNFGTCLDIFAPGSSITSTWHTSNTATNTISGTSMASPHVAGVAALYLQGNPTASPATVTNALTSTATPNKVTSAGTGSPNRLLYSLLTPPGGGGGGTCPNYSGSLAATGAINYHSSSTGFTAGTGTFTASMSGTGPDFDLRLQKLSGTTWTTVASSLGVTSTESINYSGTSGTYRWRVNSYSGSGTYTLNTCHP